MMVPMSNGLNFSRRSVSHIIGQIADNQCQNVFCSKYSTHSHMRSFINSRNFGRKHAPYCWTEHWTSNWKCNTIAAAAGEENNEIFRDCKLNSIKRRVYEEFSNCIRSEKLVETLQTVRNGEPICCGGFFSGKFSLKRKVKSESLMFNELYFSFLGTKNDRENKNKRNFSLFCFTCGNAFWIYFKFQFFIIPNLETG